MPLCIIRLAELHARNAARIVNDYMDGAESLDSLSDQSLDVSQLLDIAGHGEQLGPGLSRNRIACVN
jgi:hypothetical protein